MEIKDIIELIQIAVVPAIAAIFATIIEFAKEKTSKIDPGKREIMQRQLLEVYTPLMQIHYSDISLTEKRKRISIKHRELLESDINLLHPDLLSYGKKLDVYYVDYKNSFKSLYNQVKRNLGYSYDKNQILYRHRFAVLGWYNILQIFSISFFAIMMIYSLLWSVFGFDIAELTSLGAFVLILIMIVGVIASCRGVLFHIRRIISNRQYKKALRFKPNENIPVGNSAVR